MLILSITSIKTFVEFSEWKICFFLLASVVLILPNVDPLASPLYRKSLSVQVNLCFHPLRWMKNQCYIKYSKYIALIDRVNCLYKFINQWSFLPVTINFPFIRVIAGYLLPWFIRPKLYHCLVLKSKNSNDESAELASEAPPATTIPFLPLNLTFVQEC